MILIAFIVSYQFNGVFWFNILQNYSCCTRENQVVTLKKKLCAKSVMSIRVAIYSGEQP